MPDELYRILEQQLRSIAAREIRAERAGHLLQTTALLNETYIRLREMPELRDCPRTRVLATAAQSMRRVLIDFARAARAAKRGGAAGCVSLSGEVLDDTHAPIDVLDLNAALEELAAIAPRQARGVELRFFGGLSEDEIAEQLGVSRRTVQSDWRYARAWLRRALDAERGCGAPNAEDARAS